MVMGDDSIAWSETRDTLANLNDFSGDFVPQDRPGLPRGVPREQVRPADPDDPRANERLPRPDPRLGHVHHGDRPVPLDTNRFHGVTA